LRKEPTGTNVLEDLIAKKAREQQERVAQAQAMEASLRRAFARYLQLLEAFSSESGWQRTDVGMRSLDPYSGAGDGPSTYVMALVIQLSPSQPVYNLPYFQFAGWLNRGSGGAVRLSSAGLNFSRTSFMEAGRIWYESNTGRDRMNRNLSRSCATCMSA
jgi:hypothetical protein